MKHLHRHRVLSAVIILAILSTLGVVAPAAPVAKAQEPSAVQEQGPSGCRMELIESSPNRIVLDFWASSPQWEAVTGPDGISYDQPSIAACTLLSEVGKPELPVLAQLLGIPPEASFRLSVVDERVETLVGTYAVPPVEQPLFEELEPWNVTAAAEPQRLGSQWLKDGMVYEANAFYPGQAVRAQEAGFARQQRVLPVHFYPVQYNPVTGEARFTRYVRVALDLDTPSGLLSDLDFRPEAEQFEQTLQQSVVNYDTARTWRPSRAPVVESTPWAPPQPGYKILVEEEGIHLLTWAQIQAAIPDPGLAQADPARFQVFADGVEVALYVAEQDDPVLNWRDILFYAQDVGDKYTDQKIYWFTYGQQPGLRMTTRDGTPAGAGAPPAYPQLLHQEQNVNYWAKMPPVDTDLERYYWNFAVAGSIPTRQYNVELADVALTGAYSATLQLSMLGFTQHSVYPDHRTKFFINGHFLGQTDWDGEARLDRTFVFTHTYLLEGTNQITITLPGDTGAASDVQLMDWFELTYHREHVALGDRLSFSNENDGQWEVLLQDFAADDIWLFDVTDPAQPVQVVSGTVEAGTSFDLRFEDTVVGEVRYEAANSSAFHTPVAMVVDSPSDWGQPSHGADYIIITHADFLAQAGAVRSQKESLGYRTVVIDVQDLYDEFNYGMLSPWAIKRFLAYTYTNWARPAPAYVLLIGDGHYDYKNIQGLNKPNLLPPWMDYVDLFRGESPADNRFVTLVGLDNIPDMHIGRLPVNDAAEADAMVDKILNYAGAAEGDWRSKVLMVADDPDDGGDFYALSDELIDRYLDSAYNVVKVYQDGESQSIAGATCANQDLTDPVRGCTQDIADAINDGVLLVNYVGHAAIPWWAGEYLFQATSSTNDVETLLTNDSLWPIVLGMDCNDGFFAGPFPTTHSLAEGFVRADAKGSVANWSSAAFGFALSHQYLEYGFFEAVFLNGVRELGPATLAGKLVAWGMGARDTLDGYHLFGDPALRLRALDADTHVSKSVSVEPTTVIAPGDWLTYTLTFGNKGPATAHHVVLTDVMPAELVSATVVYASPEVIGQDPDIEFVWTLSDILSGTNGQIQVRAMVDPDLTKGIILNEASISMAEPDTNLSNNHTLSPPTTFRRKIYLPVVLHNIP